MKKAVIALAAVAALGLGSVNAEALSVGDANYLGSIDDGVPSGDTDEVSYVNALISLAAGQGDTVIGTETYNRVGSTINCGTLPCPTAVLPVSKDETSPFNTDVTGFTYLLAKYGNNPSLVWYVGNLSGVQTLPDPFPGATTGGGLSHVSLFNATSVPEGGSTLMLLGAGLAAVGALRRRFNV